MKTKKGFLQKTIIVIFLITYFFSMFGTTVFAEEYTWKETDSDTGATITYTYNSASDTVSARISIPSVYDQVRKYVLSGGAFQPEDTSGAYDYLLQPFNKTDLLKKLGITEEKKKEEKDYHTAPFSYEGKTYYVRYTNQNGKYVGNEVFYDEGETNPVEGQLQLDILAAFNGTGQVKPGPKEKEEAEEIEKKGEEGAYTDGIEDESSLGGVLLDPIADLLCSVGDLVINALQICMTGTSANQGENFAINRYLISSDKYTGSKTQPTIKSSENIDVNKFNKGWLGLKDTYYIPKATYSPEEIFGGKVSALDINFIKPNEYAGQKESIASQLRNIIAGWYVALRNLAIVGLLSILVYVGIRIILSSTAGDKAKYKQMLIDWLIALCLLFFMHYIMSFTITMVESISTSIAGGVGESTGSIGVTTTDGKSFDTNLTGLARFQTQYKDVGKKVAYLIMYLALVVYTVVFTWFYLKRVLMMAFLTIIAPLVALTYPIDKMNDGKAQAFNSWLKEFVFNALIQPFHLIIYYVFVMSALDLAATNIIYMIAALGFILPAEKILRNFFGFNKAGAGTLGGIVGGAAIGSYLSKGAKSLIGGGSSNSKGGGSSNSKSDSDKPVRFEGKHDTGEIEGIEGLKGEDYDDNNHNEQLRDNGSKEPSEEDKQKWEDFSRQQEMDSLDQELGQYTNEDIYTNPELQAKQERYNELYRQQQEQERQKQEENNNSKSDNDKEEPKPLTTRDKLTNLARYHGHNIKTGAGRAIKGAAKLGTNVAFRGAVGGLAAAVTMASGGGLGGGIAAFATGSTVGGRMASGVINTVGQNRIGQFIDRQRDIANGNSNVKHRKSISQWKKDPTNFEYLRDQLATQEVRDGRGNILRKRGVLPSDLEVQQKMEEFNPYLEEGLTDIKEMLGAQKAEQYGISSKQSAIIAAITKERHITKSDLNDEKQVKALYKNMYKEYIDKGYSKENAQKSANTYINVARVQNGVASELTKKPRTKK